MSLRIWVAVIVSLFIWMSSSCTEDKGGVGVLEGSDDSTLIALFREFRQFRAPAVTAGVPDYSTATMQRQYSELKSYQSRLANIDTSNWPVSDQIDYHLVRAEMNGLEFQHRVLRPWSLDPGFYADVISRMTRFRELPLPADRLAQMRENLNALPALIEQAKTNLKNVSEVAGDLATLALLSLGDMKTSVALRSGELVRHHPELASAVETAQAAIDDYVLWIEANQEQMTARAGVGKGNYNWLMKNVYLFPYTWEEIRTIVELEDNRVITFQRLEEHRNRDLPPLRPVQSQAEYKASVKDALDHIMNFLRENEIFTMHDDLAVGDYFGSWHGFENPWPEKHDYFFNFSHREPVMEETHEMVGHHFDELRAESDNRPIRGGRRPFKIGTARHEGFAFALEELLMHVGYLDGRSPRGREIAYEQAAFRTVRALSDVYMHSREWTLEQAMKFCVENAPHGELLEGSHHLWYELDTTLRGVGHHMLMVLGKVQFMKLFHDRANQLGNNFKLKEFMDQFFASGGIPISLIRWEMTGYEDDIKKLTQ